MAKATRRDGLALSEGEPNVDQAFVTFGAVLVLHDRLARQSPHAHRPFELLVALDEPFQFASSDGVVETKACIVTPLAEHAVLRCETRLARLYVDPGPHRLPDVQSAVPHDPLDEISSAFRHFYASERRLEDARSIIKRWTESWLSPFAGGSCIDGRVQRALAIVDEQPMPAADRSGLARSVGLSPSRFAALFAKDVGMPLRRYVLWRRVLVAARLIREGDTITRAAVRSGFSDAAHLSRCIATPSGHRRLNCRRLTCLSACPSAISVSTSDRAGVRCGQMPTEGASAFVSTRRFGGLAVGAEGGGLESLRRPRRHLDGGGGR